MRLNNWLLFPRLVVCDSELSISQDLQDPGHFIRIFHLQPEIDQRMKEALVPRKSGQNSGRETV
jgi:hypothetical protein